MSFYKYLRYEEKRFGVGQVAIFAFFAFFIALCFKYLMYHFQVAGNEFFIYKGSPVGLWTPDSGLYGFYAKELINGISYPFSAEYMPGYLLYCLHRLSGLSVETLIYWSPAFLTSLIVFPLMFTGYVLRAVLPFFYASIFGIISIGYYERTYLGYFDPDNLNLFFMLLIISGLVAVSAKNSARYSIVSILGVISFLYWYHSAKPLVAGIIVVYLLYIVLLDRKNIENYKSFAMLAVAVLEFDMLYKVSALVLLYALSFIRFKVDYRILLGLLLIGAVAGGSVAVDRGYYDRALHYFDKQENIEVVKGDETVVFKATLTTVEEAQELSLFALGVKLLNLPYLLLLGGVGFLLFAVERKALFLLLPLFGLGVAGLYAGDRFAYYAPPVFALGLFYFFWVIKNLFSTIFAKDFSKVFYGVVIFFLALATIFMLLSIAKPKYQMLNSPTLEVFEELKKVSKKGDIAIAWWDYGWPIWHYVGIDTIIDGGIHHSDNYIISKILLSDSQIFSANASRMIAEERVRLGKDTSFTLFQKVEPSVLIKSLDSPEYSYGQKTRDVFIFLSKDMLNKLFSIYSFSNIDLKDGTQLSPYLYRNFTVARSEGGIFEALNRHTGDKIMFDANRGLVELDGEVKDINSYFVRTKSGIESKTFDRSSDIYVLKYDDFMIVMDGRILNSFFIQAFIFDNVDENLFDIVAKNSDALVLRVRK